VARVLRMPEVAEDPTEGVLAEWLVEESAAFVGAQSLATVETEKLLVSVEVAEPGILVKALVETGATVDPGTPLAVLADPDEIVGDIDALLVNLGLAEPPTPPVEPAPPVELTPPVEPVETAAWRPSGDGSPTPTTRWSSANLARAASPTSSASP
jgi:pyruvate dehydrogenase E2 component (dihydrolipoamide acetyltransferase)